MSMFEFQGLSNICPVAVLPGSWQENRHYLKVSRNCPTQFGQIYLEVKDQNWTTAGIQEDFEGKRWAWRGQIMDLEDKTRTKIRKGQGLDIGRSMIGIIMDKSWTWTFHGQKVGDWHWHGAPRVSFIKQVVGCCLNAFGSQMPYI